MEFADSDRLDAECGLYLAGLISSGTTTTTTSSSAPRSLNGTVESVKDASGRGVDMGGIGSADADASVSRDGPPLVDPLGTDVKMKAATDNPSSSTTLDAKWDVHGYGPGRMHALTEKTLAHGLFGSHCGGQWEDEDRPRF